MSEIDEGRLQALPKVELHVHLEGTITPETALLLAARHGAEPETLGLVDGRYPRFNSLSDFIVIYLAVSSNIQTPDDMRLVAAAFARQQTEQNIIHTEAMFTPLTHVRNGWDPVEMWAAITDGFRDAGPGIEITITADCRRDFGVSEAEALCGLVRAADAPITGLSLVGLEETPPHEGDFRVLRQTADELGLGLAVHAGEEGPPENIVSALDDLGADRIDHGVAAAQDPALMERLARDGTPVDVCISSNVGIGRFASLEAHPFQVMWRSGVSVTVNSDDPAFFSSSLTDELRLAARLAGFGEAGLADLQRRAARASFAPETTKARILAAIDDWEAARRA